MLIAKIRFVGRLGSRKKRIECPFETFDFFVALSLYLDDRVHFCGISRALKSVQERSSRLGEIEPFSNSESNSDPQAFS